LLQQVNNYPVAMVVHHNRRKKLPELPAEALPAAKYPNQHIIFISEINFFS